MDLSPNASSNERDLIGSAQARARHIAAAIAWFESELTSSNEYRQVFGTLVRAIAEAETSSGDEPHRLHRQVHFVALGKSGGVAQLAASMFTSVGILARFLHPAEAFHGDLGSICENDTVVCISNLGNTAELLQLIPKIRERSCRTFCITSREDSKLAEACDYTLRLPPVDEFCPLQIAPITSPVATLALCQLLVAASVEQRAYNVASYARNHPGGSIGRRIYVKVADIMIRGENLPLVTTSETFPICVTQLTRFAMSVLLVADGRKLLGIISEKDIRVAMEKDGPGVFARRASELMNHKPITIAPDLLAVDALKVMKERPTPLNFLPVVDADGGIAGLVRLHDLVAAGISLL
jgi:arabinose-5-phosphate isomerase